MTGSAITTAVATTSTVKKVALITVIGVAFVLLVLILTTDSFAEPFLVLIGLGAVIAINMGSNIIFGEISFVTNAAGNILQLAVFSRLLRVPPAPLRRMQTDGAGPEGSNGARAHNVLVVDSLKRTDDGHRLPCAVPDAVQDRL